MKALALFFGCVVVLLGPNLLWLNWSTVRIENRSSQPIEGAILFVCEQPVHLGRLIPGASHFQFLPKCGDDTLKILAGQHSTDCNLYIEEDMYHVLAWFTSPMAGDCTYGGRPPFTPLLLAELF